MGDPSSAKSMSLAPAIAAGLLSAFVGYASSVTIVIQGLAGVGASPDEVASGLLVLGLAMGLPAIWFSLKTRMPISIAWSTPGSALLAGTGIIGSGFGEAVGAFITVALLIVLTGLWLPFARAIGKIPTSIANALLAGVIFQLCLAPFKAVAELPGIALPVVLLWAVVARINRYFAVPAAIVLAAVLLSFDTSMPTLDWSKAVPAFVFSSPQFTWQATVSIALPLFLVTMASQNITGLAVLKASGYEPAPGPLFVGTGLASLISAPFGAVTINLAAITAAICAGPDAHPDPGKRWVAALVAGLGYIAFGALAGIAAIAVLAAPPLVIEAVAGLALLGALAGSMKGALADDSQRTAALLTFLTTASGLAFAGIGSAFWGLIVGLFMLGLDRLKLSRA